MGSESDVALDLELGVAEPERQRFLAHDNSSHSHLFVKPAESLGGMDGFKSESSLQLGKTKSEVSLVAALGFTAASGGDAAFDVGDSDESDYDDQDGLDEGKRDVQG